MAIESFIRPITVDEYQRMADAGIIESEERIELLDGLLVRMPPIGEAHIFAHARIVRYLVERLGDRALVAGQASIPLTQRDEPQPDITIFSPHAATMPKSRWRESGILAVLEIADSSISRDLGRKLKAYARGQIGEYLVVDLSQRRLLRFRDPNGMQYRQRGELREGDRFSLDAFVGIELEAARFL